MNDHSQSPTTPIKSKRAARPRKPSKMKRILLIVLLFIVSTAIGFGVAYFMDSSRDQPKAEVVAPVQKAPMVMTAQQIVDESKTYAGESFKATLSSPTDDQSPALTPTGATTYVATIGAPALHITLDDTDADGTPVAERLVTFLTDEHQMKVTQMATETMASTELQTDDVICTVNSSFGLVVLSCDDIANFDKVATDLAPFATAILTTDDADSKSVLSGLKITQSPVSGYQTAEVYQSGYRGIGGATALFYKNGVADWQYFQSVQNTLGCDAFNTPDLQNAFADQKCYASDESMSTVTPAAV